MFCVEFQSSRGGDGCCSGGGGAAAAAAAAAIALKFHAKHEKRKQNEQIAIKKLNEHEKRD